MVEYIIGNWGEKHYEYGDIRPIYNEKVVSDRKKEFYNGLLESSERIKIVHLVVDSYSRRHFFRKLPRTVEYLNSLNDMGSFYRVFDFKIHNVKGADSIENQIYVFSDKLP
jgi:hypothetical protein